MGGVDLRFGRTCQRDVQVPLSASLGATDDVASPARFKEQVWPLCSINLSITRLVPCFTLRSFVACQVMQLRGRLQIVLMFL